MAKSMLEKLNNYQEEISEYEVETGEITPIYDIILECCATYEEYGQLLTELLIWNSGLAGWDDKVVDLLEEMYSEYLNQTI